jgi:HPt (histidine-containing phosphotransfer) domain-containing protein
VDAGGGAPDTVPAIDHEDLLARLMGKQDLVDRVVRLFRERLPEYVRDIETAVKANDAENIKLMAHRLKGAAANVSAMPVQEQAASLEKLGLNKDLDAVPDAFQALLLAVEEVQVELRAAEGRPDREAA